MNEDVPFLKWPGGKRWVAGELAELIAPHLKARYLEPFLGGGAVFFALRPVSAILSDINGDLINVYSEVKRCPSELIMMLQGMAVTKEDFLRVRACDSKDPPTRAARFLYLNRTAFGGIFRLNKRGEFNVPYGGGQRTPEILWRKGLLERASEALREVSLSCSDFEQTMRLAGPGDVVYCDPTYTVAHNINGFLRYNESVFSWSDQERLASCAFDASQRGALILISNAHDPSVISLFGKYENCEMRVLKRPSCVARTAAHRGAISESLFILWP